MLASLNTIERDPARRAIFTNSEDMLVPEPLTYADWFDRATPRLRRKAVGTRRYMTVEQQLGERPDWADFLDPTDGALLGLDELSRESESDRLIRRFKVQELIRKRGQAARQVALTGYSPS